MPGIVRNDSWLLRLLSRMLGTRRGRLGTRVWRQFHTDETNQGLLVVRSEPTLQPKCSVEIGPVSYSSPAVGDNGTVYVGTTGEKLVTVSPESVVLWAEAFDDSIIVKFPRLGRMKTFMSSLTFGFPWT
jgi:outer membrane protein assembly factor BamB